MQKSIEALDQKEYNERYDALVSEESEHKRDAGAQQGSHRVPADLRDGD